MILQSLIYFEYFKLDTRNFPILTVKLFFSLKENPPYSKGAFRIEINFPAEYPFKPPKICFKTKIYHPNIDEKGQVCLPIISTENWKPATKTDQGDEIISTVFSTDESNMILFFKYSSHSSIDYFG